MGYARANVRTLPSERRRHDLRELLLEGPPLLEHGALNRGVASRYFMRYFVRLLS